MVIQRRRVQEHTPVHGFEKQPQFKGETIQQSAVKIVNIVYRVKDASVPQFTITRPDGGHITS